MKIPYTAETKASITAEQKQAGKFLVEVQKHVDGEFLIFDDKPQADTPIPLEQKIKALEARLAALEKVKMPVVSGVEP